MIVNIDVNRIFPHPNNPRKDLGDLSELTESIKANGILQNLTVVPKDIESYHKKISSKKAYTGEYTSVIGHRRHAAAKLAGLTEVPCSISDMDEKTQIATMLLENIQRSDLTIIEQAQGFQLMLDLGDTIGNISKKTGFSDTTVRRRVKLLDLDRDKFQKSVVQGGTLQDYMELDKIKAIDLKNSVLEKIGTSNFRYALQNAIDKEKSDANKAVLIEQLKTFASPIENEQGFRRINWVSYNTSDFKKPEDAGTQKYYFHAETYGIQILVEAVQTEVDIKVDAERKKMQERRSQLDEISKRAFQLRYDFIRNYTGAKKHTRDIMSLAAKIMIESDRWGSLGEDAILELIGIELTEDDDDLRFDVVSKEFAAAPERTLLIIAYCNGADSEKLRYYEYYNCAYKSNDDLNAIYDFLAKLGYEMSDEERALREGTHGLFVYSDKCGE